MKQSRAEELQILGTFLSEKKKIITNQWEQVIFGTTIIVNMKAMVTEIKPYQSKNMSMKLNHTSMTP